MTDELIRAARVALGKLTDGRALASLPMLALLRVVEDQQRQIDDLRAMLEGEGRR